MRADLVAAYRALTASKTFTAVAVVILALGIGITAAIYSVIDATMLRRLPYWDPDRLVELGEHHTDLAPDEFLPVAPQNFLDWDREQTAFESLAAVEGARVTAVEAGLEPEDLRLSRVTADFFKTLRFGPIVGRTFSADEEIDGRHRLIVLSHALWQRRYGGDPSVVGRRVSLDGEPHEVIGVLAADAVYPAGSIRGDDGFVPLIVPPDLRIRRPNVRASYLTVIGRLAPGVPLTQAQAAMDQIASNLQAAHPAWNGTTQVRVRPFIEQVVGQGWRTWLWLLAGAAGAVLLIACANVAMLQLARAATRGHEMGVRASLGAGRWRLIRQLLVENVLLAMLGAGGAVLVATWSVAVFKSSIPGGMPRLAEVQVDLRVLAVMAATASVVGIGVGLGPALHLSAARPWWTLAKSAPTLVGRRSHHLARGLVLVETALAVALLATTSLFVRSFAAAVAVDPGFDATNVLTLTITSPGGRRGLAGGSAPAPTRWNDATLHTLVDRVGELSGVTHVTFAKVGLPFGGVTFSASLEIRGRLFADDDSRAIIRRVTPGYHEALRIPLRSGRLLSVDDREGGSAVAVVNEAAVRAYFGGSSPVGETIVVGEVPHVVVGVVGDTWHHPESDAVPELAVPLWAGGRGLGGISGQLAVRTVGDPYVVLPGVKRVAADVLPGLPVRDVTTMEARLRDVTAWRRFDAALMSLFGVLGLIIAAVGVYGTLAYGVERRTREIGVRVALGATPVAVAQLVLVEAAAAVAMGLVVGAAAAASLSGMIGGQLFGVGPRDPASYAAAAGVMLVASIAACVVPARRAQRVDPTDALRHQ